MPGLCVLGGAEVVSFVVLKVAGREVQTWLAETSNELLKTLPEGSEVIWVSAAALCASTSGTRSSSDMKQWRFRSALSPSQPPSV